jgi:hypothetical protein
VTPEERERVVATAKRLEHAARAAGVVVTADSRVSEATAAQLLGLDVRTLRRMRYKRELPSFHVALNGSRVSYRLEHLAAWIEFALEDAEKLSAPLVRSRREVDTRTGGASATAACSEPSARGAATAAPGQNVATPSPPAQRQEEK